MEIENLLTSSLEMYQGQSTYVTNNFVLVLCPQSEDNDIQHLALVVDADDGEEGDTGAESRLAQVPRQRRFIIVVLGGGKGDTEHRCRKQQQHQPKFHLRSLLKLNCISQIHVCTDHTICTYIINNCFALSSC
jgi:hypothetical protein